MELDDFKNTWKSTNSPVQNNALPNLQKMEIAHRSKLKKIIIPEIAGAIVCLAAAALIIYYFNKLDTAFLQGTGVLAILLLLVLPIISFLSTKNLSHAADVHKPYAATLKAFALQKVRFVKLQKLNVTLSYLLLVTVIVLLARIFGDKDMAGNKYYWIFSFSFGYLFLLYYSRWVAKYYRKSLDQAEELLQELAT